MTGLRRKRVPKYRVGEPVVVLLTLDKGHVVADGMGGVYDVRMALTGAVRRFHWSQLGRDELGTWIISESMSPDQGELFPGSTQLPLPLRTERFVSGGALSAIGLRAPQWEWLAP